MSPPNVTGVSPREGPPFTKLTIRGESLGECLDDIISVRICGVDCKITAEWHSPSKITVRTLANLVKGQGDIIIKTVMGGIGSSTVTFTALEAPAVGPLDYSSIWVEDSIWQRERAFKLTKTGKSHTRWQHSADGNDLTDPLGIGRSNAEMASSTPLKSIYPGKSSDITAENFEPIMLIAENYHQATFEQLKSGLDHMKKRKARQKKSRTPVANVKDSLPVFFEVYDTLQKIHQNELNGQTNLDITQNLAHLINSAQLQSEQIFETVLTSKERADKIRDALKVMNQFRSLFSLPQAIDANRKLGNFEQIIQDYTRVRQLFKDTNVNVFRNILKDVDIKMAQIENDLREKLVLQDDKDKLSLKQQEHHLSYLVQLIALRNSWKSTEDDAPSPEDVISGEVAPPEEAADVSDSLFEPCWQMFQNRCDRMAMELDSFKRRLHSGSTKKGQITKFCETVVESTAVSIIELEKLIELCKSGKINANILVKDTYLKSAKAQCAELADIAVALVRLVIFHTETKMDRFKHFSSRLSKDIFHKTEHLAKADHEKIDARDLTNVLRVIRKFLPKIEQFQDLCYDIRVKAMHAHLFDCKKSISQLVSTFDDANELHGLDIFGLVEQVQTHSGTAIVEKIDTLLQQRLLMCQVILVTKSKSEEALFARVQACHQFQNNLHQLFDTIVETVSSRKMNMSNSASNLTSETTNEQKILIALANVEKLSTHVVGFVEYFKKANFPGTDEILRTVRDRCKSTIQHLIHEYIETATAPLVTAIEPRMYATGYNWQEPHPLGSDFQVEDISPRGYVHRVLLDLLKICSEVSLFCPMSGKAIIDECIFKILEEVLRILKCVNTRLPVSSSVQAYYDVIALQACFNKFRVSTKCERLFTDIYSVIKKSSSSQNTTELRKKVEDVMKDVWVENQILIYDSFANY